MVYICESPNKAGGSMPFDLNASAKKAARPHLFSEIVQLLTKDIEGCAGVYIERSVNLWYW